MATEGFVNVTEGSGKKLHTVNKTIGVNDVHDELVQLGIPYIKTYVLPFDSTSVATANSHPFQIMNGASLHLYIYSVVAWQFAVATTASFCEWRLLRVSTAGTGGSAAGTSTHDPADAASGATGMKLPTAKGTESVILDIQTNIFNQTIGASGVAIQPVYQWPPRGADLSVIKPIRVAPGTSNGVVLKNVTAIAGATIVGAIHFVETNYAP